MANSRLRILYKTLTNIRATGQQLVYVSITVCTLCYCFVKYFAYANETTLTVLNIAKHVHYIKYIKVVRKVFYVVVQTTVIEIIVLKQF